MAVGQCRTQTLIGDIPLNINSRAAQERMLRLLIEKQLLRHGSISDDVGVEKMWFV